MTELPPPYHVLVINQHGENRGDEAAMRGMLAGVDHAADRPVRFTVLKQFSGDLPLPQHVTWLDLKPSPVEGLRLVLFCLLLSCRIRWPRLLGPWGREVEATYRQADVALSAPGGPYFGDRYAGHEVVHWFYVWLARRYRLPLMLYAPSAGPFRHRLLNVLRRRMFPAFDVITLREEVSAGYLRELLGARVADVDLSVAADSAVQTSPPPFERREYFSADPRLAERFLVGVCLVDWRFKGSPDPEKARTRYREAVVAALDHLHRVRDAHLMFVPQLYGPRHSDAEYLRSIGQALSTEVSWEVVDPGLGAERQEQIFGMVDMYVTSRYHPQIFAMNAGVPGVCIYYEHKALGFLQQVGLERLALPIEDLDPTALLAVVDEVVENLPVLREQVLAAMPAIRAAASKSSEAAVSLLAK